MDEKVFRGAMTYLSGLFGVVSEKETEIYWNHLKVLTDEQMRSSVKNCIDKREYKNFPTIAELKRYAGLNIDELANDALFKLKYFLQKKRDSDSVAFSDKALNAAANMLGRLEDMIFWDSESWAFKGKSFKEDYKRFYENGTGDDRIMGHNERIGHSYDVLNIGEVGQNILRVSHKIEKKELEYKSDDTERFSFTEVLKLLQDDDSEKRD